MTLPEARKVPAAPTAGTLESNIDATSNTPNRSTDDPRWGAVLDCAMACAGTGRCSWRPYECTLIAGDR